jgi:hypothetical protein
MTTRTASALAIAATVAAATAALSAQAKPAAPGTERRYVVIGCLSRQAPGGSAPSFIITDTRGAKPMLYRLDGDQQDLNYHVGHYIEVAGALSPASGSSANPTLKVASLVYISKTCPK